MAWSDAARAAALEARKMKARKETYTPPKGGGVHLARNEMASYLREARSTGLRGPGKSLGAIAFATGNRFGNARGYYTNVKGAHFVDQGLTGKVWRAPKDVKNAAYSKAGVPKWSAKSVGFSRSKLSPWSR